MNSSRYQRKVAFLGWMACCCWLFVVGCEVHSSGVTDVTAVKRASTTPLPEEVLRDKGLETLWYFPPEPKENPVLNASLMSGGLFITTQPLPTRAARIRRINPSTGETQWFFDQMIKGEPLKLDPTIFSHPVKSRENPDEFYFVQLDTAFVLDLEWGDLLKKIDMQFPVSTSLLGGEVFYYAGSDTGRVYGVRKDGQAGWSYRTGASVTAAPTMGASSVISTSTDGYVYRFSPVAGWVRGFSWKFETGAPIHAQAVTYSQWVVVGSTDYKMYCLNEVDGTVRWSFPAEGPIEQTPVVYSYKPAEAYAYCIAVDRGRRNPQRTLFAVNMRDGQMAWRRPGILQVVSLGREFLYVLNDPAAAKGRFLSALDVATGEERFRLDVSQFHYVPTNSADHGRNAVERGRIYLVARDGAIQVIGEKY